MNRFIGRRDVWVGGLGIASLLLLGGAFLQRPKGPPKGVLTPAEARLTGDALKGELTTAFRIENRGGQDLVLGRPSITCGCTVASVSTEVVAPGQSAIITLRGMPPVVGEKGVEVHVPTNAQPSGDLTFHLTLVGASQPPYLMIDSGPVQFGSVRPAKAEATVIIETSERALDGPSIDRVVSTLDGLRVEGGVTKEVPLPAGIVSKRYSYKVSFATPPPVGPIVGEVQFLGSDPKAGPFLTLKVAGRIVPAVHAVPASLYASFPAGETPPTMTVTLVAEDDFALEAKPVSTAANALVVRPLPGTGSRRSFEVTAARAADREGRDELVFETNHPEVKRVTVPIRLRPSKE